MIHKLTDQVWFGNWEAPMECIGQVGTIINVAHNFSLRRGRRVYWDRLQQIPHQVFYVRLALKDAEAVDEEYYQALVRFVESAQIMKKLPILTHCQMGGHRGPTSAIAVAWLLGEKSLARLTYLDQKAKELRPKLGTVSEERNKYYPTMIRKLREHATC